MRSRPSSGVASRHRSAALRPPGRPLAPQRCPPDQLRSRSCRRPAWTAPTSRPRAAPAPGLLPACTIGAMTVPGRVDAAALLLSLDPPPWALRHARAVAEVAGWLAARAAGRGQAIDRRLVETAALLHDVDKLLPAGDPARKLPHGDGSAAWLTQHGHPELARSWRTTRSPGWPTGQRSRRGSGAPPCQERIVAYADKRAGQRLESMRARFAGWASRYPDTPGWDPRSGRPSRIGPSTSRPTSAGGRRRTRRGAPPRLDGAGASRSAGDARDDRARLLLGRRRVRPGAGRRRARQAGRGRRGLGRVARTLADRPASTRRRPRSWSGSRPPRCSAAARWRSSPTRCR